MNCSFSSSREVRAPLWDFEASNGMENGNEVILSIIPRQPSPSLFVLNHLRFFSLSFTLCLHLTHCHSFKTIERVNKRRMNNEGNLNWTFLWILQTFQPWAEICMIGKYSDSSKLEHNRSSNDRKLRFNFLLIAIDFLVLRRSFLHL